MKPLLLQGVIMHRPGRYCPIRRAALCMTSLLWALGIMMIVTGCAGLRAPLRGESGPVAWQVTDLRIVERAVAGTARDLYTFTLVLQETHGAALTFTSLEQTMSEPLLNPTGVTQHVLRALETAPTWRTPPPLLGLLVLRYERMPRGPHSSHAVVYSAPHRD